MAPHQCTQSIIQDERQQKRLGNPVKNLKYTLDGGFILQCLPLCLKDILL